MVLVKTTYPGQQVGCRIAAAEEVAAAEVAAAEVAAAGLADVAAAEVRPAAVVGGPGGVVQGLAPGAAAVLPQVVVEEAGQKKIKLKVKQQLKPRVEP